MQATIATVCSDSSPQLRPSDLHPSASPANRPACQGGAASLPPVPTHIQVREAETRVENSGGIQASLAGRYALALFELAREAKALDSVAASLATLKAALAEIDGSQGADPEPVDRA